MIQYPFLIAMVFVGWVFPQLIGLIGDSFLPEGALDKTIFMSIACLCAACFGYFLNKSPLKSFDWSFDRKRLVQACIALSLIGAYFYYQVGQYAAETIELHGGAWSGPITIFFFLSRLLTIGLVIALLLHFHRPSLTTFALVAFNVSVYLERIVIRGRRAAMVELGLIVLMAFWFHRRWLPSRFLIVGLMVVGALLVNSIGEYRHTMMGENHFEWSGAGLSEVLDIDFIGNMTRIADGEEGYELSNAAINIEAADLSQEFDFGLSLWNIVVHSLIPGQIIGQEFKQLLMIDLVDPAFTVFRYTPNLGTTYTGMSDAFLSFWYFGAIKFLIIGFTMGRLWMGAVAGNKVSQMIIMLCVSPSLHAVTHSTHLYFVTFLELGILLLPPLVYARVNSVRR
jgi:hypothetical protein